MAYAKRYANEARKLAVQQQDLKRKSELEEMKESLRKGWEEI